MENRETRTELMVEVTIKLPYYNEYEGDSITMRKLYPLEIIKDGTALAYLQTEVDRMVKKYDRQ